MRATTAILIIMLCACRTETKLSDDRGVQDIFSPSEIVDLEKVLADFDKLVLEATQSSVIESGYQKLSEELDYGSETSDWEQIDIRITEFATKSISNLEDQPIFDEMWLFSFPITNYRDEPSRNDTLVEAYPKAFDGKYLKLLEHCIEEDGNLKFYKEAIQAGSSIGPTLFHGFPKTISKLNVRKDCIRLFIAIHFINARNRRPYDHKYDDIAVFPKLNAFDDLFGGTKKEKKTTPNTR